MDIRAYFSSNRKTPPSASNQSNSVSKSRKRTFIESDSEDETDHVSSRKKRGALKTYSKKKVVAISDSSDSDNNEKKLTSPQNSKDDKKERSSKKRSRKSELTDSSPEDKSPTIKKKPIQKKLDQVDIKSKFFKETSASAVFGDKPVKRDSSRLQEIQEKLKKKKPAKAEKSEVKIEDDDFDAALLQLDEIGSDWVKPKENTGDQSKKDSNETNLEKCTKINETSTSEEKETKRNNDKALKKDKVEQDTSKNKITPPQTGRLSIKDKLKQFSAFTETNKKDSTEVNKKSSSPNVFSEKSLSVKPARFSDSGYSSLSSTCDSQSSDQNETPSQKASYDSPNIRAVAESGVNNKSEVATKLKTGIETKDMKCSSQQITVISECMPWVEKYKPDSTKKIIGQQGDKSNVKKLTKWLDDWYKNNKGAKKAIFVPAGWNKDQSGSNFKAALLSGPPGVGKTTTVSLVCKELGFDVVEFNASDTRSKKLLQEEVSKMLTNTAITSSFGGDGSKPSVTKRHVLVMDEVDGMAGTEDRGGVQELIHLIKLTKVPIICMCNDRNHPKIRSLVNYCFDLRFQRPRVEQIKGYMKSVCFKEKLNISTDVLTNIITSSNNDVRLVLNHLSMLAADKESNLEASKKYVKLSPWDALRKIFSKEDHKTMSIHDKFDLFFYDYSITPLFVHENYLLVKPLNVKEDGSINKTAHEKIEKMKLYAQAADCISIGDRIDKEIRSNSAWSLLPTQAVFASYAPGEILEGYCSGQITFPAWLGKNSTKNKIDRLLQEIQIHTRLKISASKESVNLEYAPYLRNHIIKPLTENNPDGIQTSLERLHEYDLLKEDLESLSSISLWPNSVDDMKKVETKTKAAFTRLYNKNPPVRPYSLTAPTKKNVDSNIFEEEMSGDEDDNNEDESDAMILVKKKQTNQNDDVPSSSSREKPKTSKETNKKKRKK